MKVDTKFFLYDTQILRLKEIFFFFSGDESPYAYMTLDPLPIMRFVVSRHFGHLKINIMKVNKNVDGIEWPAIDALCIGHHRFSVSSRVMIYEIMVRCAELFRICVDMKNRMFFQNNFWYTLYSINNHMLCWAIQIDFN